MFNPQAYYNSRPDGIGVLEVAGQEEGARLFVPLKRSELRGEIAGPLAALTMVQAFGYSAEACTQVLEAVYRFPLPGDAAVTGVRVRFGEVEISAELKPREQAEADYEQAKQEGRQAALVTREAPDVFTLQVAGIKPGEDVTVETGYVQLARAEGSGWSLRIPLTTAPRYVRSDELTSRHAQGQPLVVLRDPGHRFALDVMVGGAAAVQSATHELALSREGAGLRVRLQAGDVLPDCDCVLSWQPQQEQRRPSLHAYVHDDPAAGQTYFLAQVAPPAVRERGAAARREVLLLVDHSGSMGGAKWAAADWAVAKFLSELGADDAFNVCLFHSTTRWFADQPLQADAATVERAVRFVKEQRDSGGTELGVALEQALSMPRAAGEYARNVLIITDAEVSDEGRILRLAGEEAEQRDRRRISVLCIDAAPNSFLATQLAERGGGLARFLTSAPEEEDITTALDEVLADWAQPALANLRLEVDRPGVLAAGRTLVAPGAIDLGDLPLGRTLWVAGRAGRGQGEELALRLAAGREEVAACRVSPAEAGARPALKALFGAWRVAGLEFLISSGRAGQDLADQLARLGYDPAQALAGPAGKPRVYAENTRHDAEQALRGLLAREALDYGLASSETAFVAVRQERGQPVEGTVAVANALPRGWSDSFLSPAGYTGSVPLAAPPAPMGFLDASASMSGASFLRASGTSGGGRRRATHIVSDQQAAPRGPQGATVFLGTPVSAGGKAMLFDSSRPEDARTLPEGTLSRLALRFTGGAPAADSLDAGLALLIYVDDMAAPRARVRLADLVRQGGERPLNIAREAGQRVKVVLVDPAGAWAGAAPAIEVAIGF
ncbi:MAG TPA: VIT and VWA domain-containing protein [Anaerolineae bacterium]|nr:VIT and VWA domain-containing protein [Anaerolineae bacterium]HOR00388.1 VIT and VWA domain-containing protein [Anaerolineae bacterium]HPL27461.1 VIT and VWA domain-containing protein [Anaerolineae bacterium]